MTKSGAFPKKGMKPVAAPKAAEKSPKSKVSAKGAKKSGKGC